MIQPARPSSYRAALLGLACALLPFSALWAHGGEAHDFTITGGRWWNGHAFAERTVYVVDGVLRDQPPAQRQLHPLDLQGAFVLPPFADAHNHQLAGEGEPAPQMTKLLAAGIFALQNPNNFRHGAEASRPLINRATGVDVRYAHGGLTSRGGHPQPLYQAMVAEGSLGDLRADQLDGEAFFLVDSAAELAQRWPTVLAGQPDFVKIYLERSEDHALGTAPRGLDPRLAATVVELAHAAGLPVAAHVRTVADFRAAVAAGVDQIHHLPLGELTDDDLRRAAAAKVTVVPTFLSHRHTGEVADLAGLYRRTLARFERFGVAWVLGTDDTRKTVVDELLALEDLGVVDRTRLLELAVVKTPQLILPGRHVGCWDDGCEASLLAFERNPLEDLSAVRRVRLAMKQGVILDLPKVQPGIGEALVPLLQTKGVEAAIAEYQRLAAAEPERWNFAEAELNTLGYALLRHGRAADARLILELNAQRFPASLNAQDSLADACLALADPCSEAAFRRVIELAKTYHGPRPDVVAQLVARAQAELAKRHGSP